VTAAFAAFLGLTVLAASPALGAAAPPTAFGLRVQRAGAIFAGTVTELTWEQRDVAFVTHVRFRDVRYVVGAPRGNGAPTEGATTEGRLLVTAGLPEFKIGQRYIILAKEEMGPAGSWIPLAAIRAGLFHVDWVGDSGETMVSDSARRPIGGIERGEIILATQTARGEKRCMSEDEFLSAIRKLLRA
jgi:hypothetical protein